MQKKVKWPCRRVCDELGLSYSTFMRWKERHDSGKEILEKPGPGKVEPLDIKGLYQEILDLSHGKKRSGGTGALYEKYRSGISRRELLVLVKATRREIWREKEMTMRRIEWKTPGLVWSMDDTTCIRGARKEIHVVSDLGSKYKFPPLTGDELACGEDTAIHMEWLIEKHGAPLFLKRDNHSNLNNRLVDDVLSRHMIIPLNSPAHYPPYNGAMERGQGEIKRELDGIGGDVCSGIQMACELAMHRLNHKARRSLGQSTSCERFSNRKALNRTYDKRKREEVFEEILAMTVRVVVHMGLKTTREIEHAWRLSVETWLQRHGHITVSRNGKVLPYFP